MSTLYRSRELKKGLGRKPGTAHFHIDCSDIPSAEQELVRLAQYFEILGWPAKVNRILSARRGDHISSAEYAEIYKEHTPELFADRDAFAIYLTAFLGDFGSDHAEAQRTAERVLSETQAAMKSIGDPSVVCELERVTAVWEGNWRCAAETPYPSVFAHTPVGESNFEIHHAIDFAQAERSEVAGFLDQLMSAELLVGGWFMAGDAPAVALRSVRFSHSHDLKGIEGEQKAIIALLRASPLRKVATTRCVVEQILGIWRAPVASDNRLDARTTALV